MPETDHNAPRTRLTLDMSARLNQAVEDFASENGFTKAEVLRNAVEFLLKAKRASNEGLTVGAWKNDAGGRLVEREIVTPGL